MNSESPPAATVEESEPPSKWRALRIWPLWVLIVLMVVTRSLPRLFPEGSMTLLIVAMMGPLVGGFLILIWWLTASRSTWRERLVGFAGLVVAFFITSALVDPTMKGGPGMMHLTIPVGMIAFAAGAILLRQNLTFRRTWIALLLATFGFSTSILFRNSGMSGEYTLDLHWRFKDSPEDRLVAAKSGITPDENSATDPETIKKALENPEVPGFRGADRSGTHRGPAIDSNWEAHPPELIWKTAVGPGWSSFSVAGDYLFTQEQRGPKETVVCYHAGTGQEIWASAIDSRFEEPLGGPGPRATPTLASGGVFAMGAEGWLMRLAPGTGEILWKQDLRTVAGRKPPMWGFSSSPWVTESAVIVHAGGAGEKGILAFDVETGELRWSAASGDHSYASPQGATIAGRTCLFMLTNRGLDVLDPETGVSQLAYEWQAGGYRALQSPVVGADSVLLPTGMNFGVRRIHLSQSGEQLIAEEEWTSRKLKPDFNDFVVFQNHAYGFDNSIFTCIDLETGERSWKGGRYGKGQVLLLENSGLLLVAGEQGEVVLLEATSDAHTEVAKFQALEGKTWNHPVVVGDRLYVRNSQEAACFRLPMAAATSAGTL